MVCKYFQEVHGMHFGALKKQLSFHTGVKYSKEEDLIVQSFATISKELNHGPHAIWAHMELIFRKLKPEVDTFHFVSDGPTT